MPRVLRGRFGGTADGLPCRPCRERVATRCFTQGNTSASPSSRKSDRARKWAELRRRSPESAKHVVSQLIRRCNNCTLESSNNRRECNVSWIAENTIDIIYAAKEYEVDRSKQGERINMEVTVDDVVMPGDTVKLALSENTREKIILGPGLRRDGDTIYASKSGVLRKRNPSVFYVDSYQRRYIPSRGEDVVGVVTQKAGDIFKVDVGGSDLASLSYLAFEGTSKKNRPDVQVGDAVFAKLLVASKDMEPELVCVDSHGKKGKLGVLDPSGMLLTCSLSLVRKIRDPGNPFLSEFAKEQAYELAIGMNGRVWIRARSVKETVALANAILAAEFTPHNEMRALCSSISQIVLECS